MAPDANAILQRNENTGSRNPARLSMEALHRTISDISFHLMNQESLITADSLPPIPEIEIAKCECCGMSEEFTPHYVKKVREKNYGRMICGLCSEAVNEEMEKHGRKKEDALHAHVSACARFNRVGRAFPVLCQAEAMREVLRNSRAKSMSPRDKGRTNTSVKKGGISRSSSCIPAIAKDINAHKTRLCVGEHKDNEGLCAFQCGNC